MRITTDAGSPAARYGSDDGFGIEHLPYASFSPSAGKPSQIGTRLGDTVFSLAAVLDGAGSPALNEAVAGPNLDHLLAAGHAVWDELRDLLCRALVSVSASRVESYDVEAVQLHMPFAVADFVDFYASEHHATNVGRMFRPMQPPLLPNWKHLPIGYHGRAGTITISGADIRRPNGLRPEPDGVPSYGPSRRLDIEAEVGFVLGGAVPGGQVSLEDAPDHIFGLVLLNDWSARDIQAYEYVPLGPFLGKSFATTISPWITPLAALQTARVTPPARDTALAPYLDDVDNEPWGFDLQMEVVLQGETVSRPPFATSYWTAPQMLAHMTVNGASLRPGDFFAGGTVSGPERDERGSFLELTWDGKEPLRLADGSEFTFLRDGDVVTLRATAPGPDGSVIRFGDCTGRIIPTE